MFSIADKYYRENTLYRGQEVLEIKFPTAPNGTTTDTKYLRIWEQKIGMGPVSLYELLLDLHENYMVRMSVRQLADILGVSFTKIRTWLELLEDYHFILRFRYVVGKRELTPLIIIRNCIPLLGPDDLLELHPHWQNLHRMITHDKVDDNCSPYKVSQNTTRSNLDHLCIKGNITHVSKQSNTVNIDNQRIKRIENLCWLFSALYYPAQDNDNLKALFELEIKNKGYKNLLSDINKEIDRVVMPILDEAKKLGYHFERKDIVKLLVDLGRGREGAATILCVIKSLPNFSNLVSPIAALRSAALRGIVYTPKYIYQYKKNKFVKENSLDYRKSYLR